MAGLTNLSILKGAGRFTFDGIPLWSKEGARFRPVLSQAGDDPSDTFELPPAYDAAGIRISFRPETQWDDDNLDVLFSMLALTKGQSVIPAGEAKPLVFNSVNGKKITFHCAAISKPPGLFFKHGVQPFQEMEFSIFPVEALTDPAALYTIATETYPTNDSTLFDRDLTAFNSPWYANWTDAAPFENGRIACDGWRVNINPSNQDEKCNGALNDVTMEDLAITVTGAPNLTEAFGGLELARLQGADNVVTDNSPTDDLVIYDGNGRTFTLKGAIITDGDLFQSGRKLPSTGEITWTGYGTNNAYPLAAIVLSVP